MRESVYSANKIGELVENKLRSSRRKEKKYLVVYEPICLAFFFGQLL